MTSISNPLEFAEFTFGSADLGDKRRTKRLVDGAAALAKHPGLSIPGACEDDGARLEGFYKLIRNDDVCPVEIRKAAYTSTSAAAKDVAGDILLIHDTTSVSPVHSLRDQLRTKKGSPCGYEVHTGMLVGVDDGAPIGVLGQLIWSRNEVAQKEPWIQLAIATE